MGRFCLHAAIAWLRSLEEVMLHALKVGSPPDWENVPDEFKADLAALARLADEALWNVATGHKIEEEMARHFELLERNTEHALTPAEQVELVKAGCLTVGTPLVDALPGREEPQPKQVAIGEAPRLGRSRFWGRWRPG